MSERDAQIGRRVHAVVAGFCRAGLVPEPTRVWVTVCKVFAARPVPQNSGAKQRAACAVSVYFSTFYRPSWRFSGAEVSLGTGRIDLVWLTPTGLVVIDELKAGGLGEVVDDPDTLAQVANYCEAGARQWEGRFAGVRLLPLAAPGLAMWSPAGGASRTSLSLAPAGVR